MKILVLAVLINFVVLSCFGPFSSKPLMFFVNFVIQGDRGVQGQKYKLILYESVFQYEVSAFCRMSISRSVLEIFTCEFGRVCRKSPISVNFPI